jgi:4-amino-4-deoxy-L-arabinose transferase-like glycosyltransferase
VPSTRSSLFPLKYLLAALAVYSLLQLLFLGLAPIAGSTEAREGQVIDTIVREGEWILPLRNGIIPSKPPLFHWIGASISSALGDVSELSVRLPSHLAALGILLCSGVCAVRVARFSQTVEGELHQERVALVAPALLSLTYGFHQLASQAMVDMTFSFCMWGALTALVCSATDEWKTHARISWKSRALFWTCCAGAMLARGPVGVALPIVLVGISGWYLAGLKVTVREFLRPSIGWLAFAVPLAWYYTAYLKGGEAFLTRQLLFENVQRFVGGEKINTESWWFYIPSLMRTTAPWGALALYGAIRYATTARSMSYLGGFQRWTLAPTVALITGITLLSLSSGKRHSYTLPLLPLVAIQGALFFSMFVERHGLPLRERLWHLAHKLESVVSFVLILAVVGVGIAHTSTWNMHPLEDIVKFACGPLTLRIGTVVLLTLLSMYLMRRSGTLQPYPRVWILLLVTMTLIVSAGNVIKGTLKGWPLMTEQLLLITKPGQQITVIKDTFDEYFDPIFFYAHRPITIASNSRGIERCDPQMVYVARRSWLSTNPELVPGEIVPLTTLRELKRAFNGGTGDDIEVFSCFSHAAPATPAPTSSFEPIRTVSAYYRTDCMSPEACKARSRALVALR